jgi:RNA polymerase sigma factor (sigma-70 family)
LPLTDFEIHRDLIEKAMDGNPSAQRELYNLYSKAMFNICCRIMNNSTDAEDMLQEAFIDAFTRMGSFRFESTFGAWLKRITINKCLNELKRRKIQFHYDDMSGLKHIADDTFEESTDIEYSVEKIKHAMALLPDGYRVIFSLYLMEGYDHEEIACILNISESTSKTQLMRAKKKIVEILKAGSLFNTGIN